MEIKRLSEWGIGDVTRPLIISGPCSAETFEQTYETAKSLHAIGINVFRAGIWKPRTRPGNFEGIGAEGLSWLKKVKEDFGMKVAIEVANPQHVFEAIKAGIDIVWIGARTSVNPFAIQEIADALKGYDIPVMVKNPVNPDLELWLGAFERLSRAGITKLAALHRGFSGVAKSKYRNEPHWQIMIELQHRMPNLPLICDPSHLAGSREFLEECSQKALDLRADGLMIESHCNPDKAWSDSQQQLTPQALKLMLEHLVIRYETADSQDYKQKLAELRTGIDMLDDQMIYILGKRMNIVRQIGKIKKDNNVTVLQSTRWKEIMDIVHEKGRMNQLSDEFLDSIFHSIHDESINIQEEILNK